MIWWVLFTLWFLSFPLSAWAKRRQARQDARPSRGEQTGPKWEQDKPYDLDEGDDL